VIKLDVEGAEYSVLKGAEETLARYPRPKWLIEICLNEFHPQGLNPHYFETFELFWSNGYTVRTADDASKEVTRDQVARWVAQGRSDSGVINYLCT
jgi:hypothetical protein